MYIKYIINLPKNIFFILIFFSFTLPVNSELSVEEIIKGRKALFSKNYSTAKRVQTFATKGDFDKAKSLMLEMSQNYKSLIEYFPENFKLIGTDKIKGKKDLPNLKFDIRFHLDPSSKVMKTQDNKTILIEIGDEGWKFNCNNYEVNIENGLFFNSKSTYVENQNIFISGIINSKNSDIKWELIKI